MSTNEFPRPISFADIQPDDTVERYEVGSGAKYRTQFVVATRTVRELRTAEGAAFFQSVCGEPGAAEWTLLDRPVKRGPAWDAAPGSLWTLPTFGSRWVRMETSDVRFICLKSQTSTLTTTTDADRGDIDRLVPFSPPSVDERERLRDNAIEAISNYVGILAAHGRTRTMAQWADVSAAVRALRDYEAAQATS